MLSRSRGVLHCELTAQYDQKTRQTTDTHVNNFVAVGHLLNSCFEGANVSSQVKTVWYAVKSFIMCVKSFIYYGVVLR